MNFGQGRYRNPLNHKTDSFAYHQVIPDISGNPVDYIFLDVNPDFSLITGLSREQVRAMQDKSYPVLGNMHPSFRPSVKETLAYLQEQLAEALLGACVVGSSVAGDWDEGSDIDFIYVTKDKLNYSFIFDLEEGLQKRVKLRVQLIAMQPRELEEHLKNRTTMAHSIRRGLVLMDKQNYFYGFARLTDADLPLKPWMKKHFLHFVMVYYSALHAMEREKEMQEELKLNEPAPYGNDICRPVVNFSILYLELHGIIPTSKKQVLRGLEKVAPELVADARDSMYFFRQDRLLTQEEAKRLGAAAADLKNRLQVLLQVDDEEMDRYNMYKHLRKESASSEEKGSERQCPE